MNHAPKHINVCICTFRRPAMLRRLLGELARQQTGGQFTYSIVVVDNDDQQSARPVVADFAAQSPIEAVYCLESRQNIALARNKSLEYASGDYIAFIDDDEFPVPEWLSKLLASCEQYRADGVLGPVRPHFEESPPGWIIKGRFCERPEHETGRRMPWDECRTGNFLFRRRILDALPQPFDPKFGTGGEDMDFFMRMAKRELVFVWCNEAVAYETVPPARMSRTYMLKRALLRGRNILKHPNGMWRYVTISLLAVPLYLIFLPVTTLLGDHWFMKYCIKLCDHAGRVLAVVGLNPVKEREM